MRGEVGKKTTKKRWIIPHFYDVKFKKKNNGEGEGNTNQCSPGYIMQNRQNILIFFRQNFALVLPDHNSMRR